MTDGPHELKNNAKKFSGKTTEAQHFELIN